jgi:hypothetical protein
MDNTFPLDIIENCLNGDGEARGDGYSGKGMYGKTCAAITFDDMTSVFMFFTRLGAESDEYAANYPGSEWEAALRVMELAGAARTDSMGRGIVVYFPGWTFA